MAISASIIPGKVFEEGEAVNISTLNLLGNPTVNIEGAVSTLGLEDDSITNAKVNSAAAIATAKLALSSAIEVDGANVGIGGTAKTKLDVIVSAVTGYSSVQNDGIVIERGGATAALNIATDYNQQGAIWFADGDAANSGQIIYDHADDSLQLGTAATEAMRIASDGNLEVFGDASFGANSYGALEQDSSTVRFRNTTTGEIHIMTHSGNEDINLNPAGYIQFETAGAEAMRISADGEVGIGTDDPSCELEIAGSGTLAKLTGTGTTTYLKITDATSDGGNFIGATGDTLHFWTDNEERMRITSDGEVKVVGTGQSRSYTSVAGTRLTLEDTNPNITILGSETSESSRILFATPSNQNEGTIGYSNNSDYMWFETDDEERMRITSDGHVILANVQEGSSGLASGTIYKDSGFLKIVA